LNPATSLALACAYELDGIGTGILVTSARLSAFRIPQPAISASTLATITKSSQLLRIFSARILPQIHLYLPVVVAAVNKTIVFGRPYLSIQNTSNTALFRACARVCA